MQSAESDRVVSGFANTWPKELGDRPALWIPASSIAEARLEATAGAKTVSDSRSLVTSPVLLAVRPQLKDALAQQTWATLPQLQSSPPAMNALKLPGWGTLKLALPTHSNGDAASLAAEAVAAASAPAGAPPTSGMSGVSSLLREAAQARRRRTGDRPGCAAQRVRSGDRAGTRGGHHRTTGLPAGHVTRRRRKSSLAGWVPPGSTATADYPTVLLAGDWLEKEQVTAANEFARYLRKPEQLAELAKAGFRAEGTTPPSSDVTDFGSWRPRCRSATTPCGSRWPTRPPRRREAPPSRSCSISRCRPKRAASPGWPTWWPRSTAGSKRYRTPQRSACGPSTAPRAGQRCRPGRWPSR